MRSVNLGRWSRRVERYFNIKGGHGLDDVDPSVRLILPIASGQEDRLLEGWDRFGWNAITAAVAAQTGAVQLRNIPATGNAGVVVVIERLTFYTNAATTSTVTIDLVSIGSDLSNLNTGTPLDGRTVRNSTAIPSQTSNGADIGNRIMQVTTSNVPGAQANLISTVNQEITLLPTWALRLVDQTVNEQLVVQMQWRERALEASELTG